MKIVTASDLHLNTDCRTAFLQQVPHADLAIVAGDFARRRDGLADFMAPLDAIAKTGLFVPGNNETAAELRAATHVTVLHGDNVVRSGLSIFGLGCAIPPLPPLPWGSFDMTEVEAEAILSDVAAADVVISHSPPLGHCDYHQGLGQHRGSAALLAFIERVQPQLFLCGHVHDSWGGRSKIGRTMVANLGPVPVFFEVEV
ncbi:MAG: metallophosphoesterase [Pseudomonadota bacterium]